MDGFYINTFLSLFWPGALSALIAFGFTPIAIKVAWMWGMIDDPKKHKHPKVIHTYPIPRGGGMSIFAAILLTTIFFLPLDKHLIGIILAGIIVLVTGLVDDKYNISPYTRLGMNFLAGVCVVAFGVGVPYISSPWGGIIHLDQPRIVFQFLGTTHSIWLMADLFAILWIAWTMNFVSISSGIDGQVSGVVVIAALTITGFGLRNFPDSAGWSVMVLSVITAGAYLGFLPWHIYPQKIMPGYSGATLAGYMLAVLSILSTAKIGTLLVVLGVPFLDVSYSVVRRIISGRSPFSGDRGHLHHKLLDLGWSKQKVAVFYWLVTLFLGFLALNLNSRQKVYTIVAVAVVIGGFLLWVNYFSDYSKR